MSLSSNTLEEEINEEFVALSPKQPEDETIKTIEVVYINDEIINEEADIHDVSDTAGSATDGDSDEVDEITNESDTDEDNQASVSKVTMEKRGRGRLALLNKCQYCKKYLRTKNDLIKHIIKRHDKNYYQQFPYQCQKCIKGFKSRNGLKFHLKIHGSLVFVQCPLCPANLRDNYFATHIMTHESETCFPCQVCGEIFSSHEQRLLHWKTHAADQPFGCNICYRRYKKHQYLVKHLKCHKLYKCNFCKEEFNSPAAQRPPYACRNCEKLRHIKKKVKYLRYKEAEEPTEANSTKEDSNLESLDDNTPSGSLNYTTQTINHATKGVMLQYKCQDCKYAAATKRSMLKHLAKWHRKYKQTNLPFKCEHCNRSFQTKPGLNCHLKTHDKKNQFQCPVCPLTVYRESIFVAHVMLHEDESCFPCQVCAKIFPSNTERMAHYQPHITERPYGCDICYRRFYHHHYLRSHMKTHGVYFCNFCPQHFNSAENLQKPYVCGNCEKLPDIKSTVEHQRSLSSKKHVFESDEEDEDDRNTSKTSNPSENRNEEFFAITAVGQQTQQQDDKELIQVIYVNDQNDPAIANTEENNEEFIDTISCYASSEEDEEYLTDLESNDGHEAGSSQSRLVKKGKTTGLAEQHKCNSCEQRFKTKKGLRQHMFRIHYKNYHKQLPLKCDICNRGFNTRRGIRIHLKTHDEKNLLQCPVCSSKHQKHYFINHVLTHESDSCFPCQVCGKVYNSQDERLKHWETHAADKPFVCLFCNRRYKQQQYLTHHLKIHCQYQCNFCTNEFNSIETQRSPYVCPSCAELPEVKQKIEQLKLLSKKSHHVLESDENLYPATHQPDAETNDGCFTITPIDNQETPQHLSMEQDNKELSPQVVYVKNEADEKNEYDDSNCTIIEMETNIENPEEVNDSDTCYFLNDDDDDDDTDLECNDDNEASGSKSKRKSKPLPPDLDLSSLKCPYCPAGFKNKPSATRHVIRYHGNKLPIKCGKCHRGFLNANGLKVHLKAHDHLQCPICKSEHIENYFITHILTHESDTCFPCQVCGKIYSSQAERMRHWKTHAKEKPFACDICFRRYGKMHYLTRHLKFHNQYHCSFCAIAFNSIEALRAPYVCMKCEKLPDIKQKIENLKMFMNNSDVVTHEMDENTITPSNPAEEFVVPYQLPSAATDQEMPENKPNFLEEASITDELNTSRDSTLNEDHIKIDLEDADGDDDDEISDLEFIDNTAAIPTHIDTDVTAHKCQHCERDFHSKQGLDLHIRQIHNNTSSEIASKHKCLECNKEFRTRSTLSHHKKTHDKSNQFQCPVCPTRKFGEGSFIVHVMLHENESCFPCQVCGKIFASNEERMAHWDGHIKERPHGCKICYRRFAQKHILQRHMKAHSQ